MQSLVIHFSISLVLLACTWQHVNAQTKCKDPFYIPNAQDKLTKLNRAWMILYGKDVTPQQGCPTGDTSKCNRRQIDFEVYCIIKGSDDVPQRITIGGRVNITGCDGTYFAYDQRDEELLVIVKRINLTHYEWDELVPITSAKYALSDFDLSDLSHACGANVWKPPTGNKYSCPNRTKLSTDKHCPKACRPHWHVHGDTCYLVSRENNVNSWQGAYNFCKEHRGQLAIITSEEEWAGIKTLLPPNTGDHISHWTAGKKRSNQWVWVYNSGITEVLTYTNWTTGQPSSGNYLVVGHDEWMTSPGKTNHSFLCEEPAQIFPFFGHLGGKYKLQFTIIMETTMDYDAIICCRRFISQGMTYKTTSGQIDKLPSDALQYQPTFTLLNGEEGFLYTLILADIAGAQEEHGTMLEPFINWMVVNLPYNTDNNFTTADTVLPYMYKPVTVNRQTGYTFRVYRQAARLQQDNWQNHLKLFSNHGGCQGGLIQRCRFSLELAETMLDLTLEGAAFVNGDLDLQSVYYQIYMQGKHPGHVCKEKYRDTVYIGRNVVCGQAAPTSAVATSRTNFPVVLALPLLFTFYFIGRTA